MNSSSETISSGKRANKTGGRLESFVKSALIEHDYEEFAGNRTQLFDNRKAVGGKQYATQVDVGMTIYESQRKVDFLILNSEKWPDGLIIECKWQQVAGSVDEKYPFLYFNIVKTGVPTIVLLDGGGCKATAKTWLKSMAHKEKALVAVWDMSEFQKQVNNGFFS
jgi:hypothetical protein